MTDYTLLADAIAADIGAGRLKTGDRLPPQRRFADDHGIAFSTAGRVYAALRRRGLVVGEVGRGTFVAGLPVLDTPRTEPHDGPIDLEFNYPTIPEVAGHLARAMAGLQRADAMAGAIAPLTSRQVEAARGVLAGVLSTPHWEPDPDALLFTGSGRQSIAAALSTLVPVGGRVAVEALSYPMVRSIAARIGVSIVPVPLDANGLVPQALERAHRKAAISAVYVQPVMHNPLGMSMGKDRREELVRTAARLGIGVVEDRVYGFLSDTPPLSALAPDHCVIIDSFSKRVSPGLSVGLLHVPARLRERTSATVRGGAWTAPPLALNLALRLAQDDAIREIVARKRQEARRRQSLMARMLAPHTIQADRGSYHLWLELPRGWRAEAFAAAAARAGVAVTPASAFAMAPGHAPAAVRLALGLPPHGALREAARRLQAVLAGTPDDLDITE